MAIWEQEIQGVHFLQVGSPLTFHDLIFADACNHAITWTYIHLFYRFNFHDLLIITVKFHILPKVNCEDNEKDWTP